MGLIFSAERALSPRDGSVAFVVVDENFEIHREASAYLASLRSLDRSHNTERVYAGRVALFLTYCSRARLDWRTVAIDDLARFVRSLVDEPMPIRRDRRSHEPRFRTAKTANAILTSVIEFLRFGVAQGWVQPAIAQRLSHRRSLIYRPAGYDFGEYDQFRWVKSRSIKLSQLESAPETLTDEQISAVREAMPRTRDRLLISLLTESGMRIGEALGLRRHDMHLLASSSSLGCQVTGPHVHVRRRINANGALAKSRYERSLPVTSQIAELYATYQHERACVPLADGSDFVFVNLYKPPVGEPLRYHNAKKLFERTSLIVGFAVRPHMLRHSAATRWLAAGTPRDVVQSLLGHASMTSVQVYIHPTDQEKRDAIEQVAARSRDSL